MTNLLEEWLDTAARALGQGDGNALIAGHFAEIQARPGDPVPRINLGLALLRQGRDADALASLDAAMTLTDSEPVGWLALAAANRRLGRVRESISALWNAVRIVPGDDDLVRLLAEGRSVLMAQAQAAAVAGRHDEADDLFDHALLLTPDDWGAMHDQGVNAFRRRRFAMAVDLLERAVKHRVTPVSLCNLGAALSDCKRDTEALAVYRRCIETFPDHAPAYFNAGCSLAAMARFAEAEAMYHKAMEIKPDYADAYNNLGTLLGDLGRAAESLATLRRAIEIRPVYELAHSNLLFQMYYLPEMTGPEIAAEARRWGEANGRPPGPVARHANSPDPERMLRVGYLSPDFRDHAASYYMEPLLEHHDRTAFQLTCYSMNKVNDHVTERMKAHGHAWVEVASLSDRALAERIRADGIDILVDCAGHTNGNRLAMFALEPAPVQVGNHLGMAGTLGVPAIRHFITDRYIAPEGTDDHFTEHVVRMSRSFMPFRPRPEWPEVFARQPGPPVFGFFSEPLRMSPPLVESWRRILDAVPGSRLLLKHSRYVNKQTVRRYRDMLASLGDRCDFEDIGTGWADQWQVYGRLSVMLDGFPVTAATSTVIPLWMGVPVVSLGGSHSGQRFGVSMLTNGGLPELIAGSLAEYEAIAIALANDPDRLARYRATLRTTLAASPLFDAVGGTRELESIYRSLWRDWCASQSASTLACYCSPV
jgi:protein O-GlcNAc transferase